jgi:X-Pro dipeptidyl-peptidase (S15 family)
MDWSVFAEAFAADGFVVLLHDHRTLGASDGASRQDEDPWQQIADWRRAVSFLESRSQVDAGRIGLWGTSYAGGHAIVLGATDCRLRCVVAQVPTISGYEQGLRRVPPDASPAWRTRSPRTSGPSSAARRPVCRRSSATTPWCRPPTGPRTRSSSTSSRCPRAPGRTR